MTESIDLELEKLKQDLETANRKAALLEQLANKLLKACQIAFVGDESISRIALSEAIALATGQESKLVVLPREKYTELTATKE